MGSGLGQAVLSLALPMPSTWPASPLLEVPEKQSGVH